ncbi:MAG: patatin-like phospholipase/acyl hydrolase [bacterium]|jgi:patatin-like phospholipase/acyl hydrolase
MSQDVKRILTIDGGGIKGTFPASFLASIEDTVGDSVFNYFDLIVGTSTGGIIALGLGLGFSGKEVLHFYEKLGPEIFKGNGVKGFFKQWFSAKYNQEPLKKALIAQFEEKRLGESNTRLVIPSCNLETGEVHVYKTSHHNRLEMDYKEKVVDVALATAAAPTYFPTHINSSGIPLIDGGVWANNPVGAAVVEAIGVLNWPRESLKILSLGCPSEPLNIKSDKQFFVGKLHWASRIVDVFMKAQSSASFGTAQLLAGHENVIRICPEVGNGKYDLDKIDMIDSLKGLGVSEARKALPKIKEIFFQKKVKPFSPYHKLSD